MHKPEGWEELRFSRREWLELWLFSAAIALFLHWVLG